MFVLKDVVKKAIPVLALIAALCAFVLGSWVLSLRAENKRLGGAVAGLTADLALEQELRLVDQQVAKDYAKKVTELSTQRIANAAKLNRAVQANPEWAAGRVPDDVADALGLRDPD